VPSPRLTGPLYWRSDDARACHAAICHCIIAKLLVNAREMFSRVCTVCVKSSSIVCHGHTWNATLLSSFSRAHARWLLNFAVQTSGYYYVILLQFETYLNLLYNIMLDILLSPCRSEISRVKNFKQGC
jgi:hypothetical protein